MRKWLILPRNRDISFFRLFAQAGKCGVAICRLVAAGIFNQPSFDVFAPNDEKHTQINEKNPIHP
jgi:hypothetical protein